MNTSIKSPLTGSTDISLEKRIQSTDIIDSWKRWPNLNVSQYFHGVEYINLYKCNQTGYRFYFPYSLEGDSLLYQQLQKFDWYYKKNKWEYQVALKEIQNSDRKVLELGCGVGYFLRAVQSQKHSHVIGLELNEQAASIARSQQIEIHAMSIEDFSRHHIEEYDVVCAFQVLEHISDVKSFLLSLVSTLKPYGKLIISVPNNDSYIKRVPRHPTNLPPHHMGLWNKKALNSLQKIFPLQLQALKCEPLQEIDWFYTVYTSSIISHLPHKRPFGRIKKDLTNLTHNSYAQKITKSCLRSIRYLIPGHTILAIFTKLPES